MDAQSFFGYRDIFCDINTSIIIAIAETITVKLTQENSLQINRIDDFFIEEHKMVLADIDVMNEVFIQIIIQATINDVVAIIIRR